MTNEEAIKDIEENILPIVGGKSLLMAIAALEGKDTNVHTSSALGHIHNVVAEREYQRGYEQAKEEYDHKLTEIRSRIKDHYCKQGKKDAIPVDWIEAEIKKLRAMNFELAAMTAGQIEAMLNKWRKEQEG